MRRAIDGVRALVVLVALGGLLSGGALTFAPAAAQTTQTGVICVTTFADTNGNGLLDADETPLAGVNVNLSTGGAIIATHITDPGESEYCFQDLLRGIYTITFTSSPLYRITTASEGTFALDAGQRLTLDPFGAFPIGVDGLRAELVAQASAQNDDKPLDQQVRLLLAMAGSLLVMLFMIGIGAVLLGITSTRRRSRRENGLPPVPPPTLIRPPQP